MNQADDLFRAKRGVAVLAAVVVQTLNESDPTYQERFLTRLAAAYRELKDDSEGPVNQELELLSWTRELLTGWTFVKGQERPFLDNYNPKQGL